MQGPVEIYLHFFTFSARTMCSKPITQFTIHKVPAHVHVSLIIKFWLDAGAREKNFLRARTFYLLSSYFMRRFIQQNAHQLSFIWSSAGRKVSQGSFCVHWHTIQRRAYSSSTHVNPITLAHLPGFLFILALHLARHTRQTPKHAHAIARLKSVWPETILIGLQAAPKKDIVLSAPI